MTRVPRPRDGIRAGTHAAERAVTSQADAGMNADAIADRQDEDITRMLTEVRTRGRQDFARGYAVTTAALLADLRALETGRPEPDMTPGRPHPDRKLAERGWQVGRHGIYERTGQRQPDRDPEAG